MELQSGWLTTAWQWHVGWVHSAGAVNEGLGKNRHRRQEEGENTWWMYFVVLERGALWVTGVWTKIKCMCVAALFFKNIFWYRYRLNSKIKCFCSMTFTVRYPEEAKRKHVCIREPKAQWVWTCSEDTDDFTITSSPRRGALSKPCGSTLPAHRELMKSWTSLDICVKAGLVSFCWTLFVSLWLLTSSAVRLACFSR